MPHISEAENLVRQDFCLDRLKKGFSALQVKKQFEQRFNCSERTARRWLNKTCDDLSWATDGAETRKRAYRVLIEMHHDQIVQFQGEILSIQQQIDQICAHYQADEALGRSKNQQHATLMVSLIEAKSRTRQRMQSAIMDLARLRGFLTQSNWRQAVNVLLDSNFLPTEVAENILKHLEHFEGGLVVQD